MLGGQKCGRIDNRSGRSGLFGRRLLRGCRRGGRSGLDTTAGLVTAAGLATIVTTTARLGATILVAAFAEDPVKQGNAAAFLARLGGTTRVAATARLTTAGRLATIVATTTGLRTAALLLALATQHVQQRRAAALLAWLGGTARVATATGLATIVATTARLVAATFRAALAAVEQPNALQFADTASNRVDDRRVTTSTLRGATVASVFNSAAGICGFTAADSTAASVIVHSEHSVEQVEPEALGTQG